jgi:HK97 family phage prohead protease
LAFDLDLPNTTLANDLLELASRSDLGGMSFAFVALRERWDGDYRELQSVDLKEISVVQSFPAYEGTTISARSRPLLFPSVALARRYLETL